MCSLHVVRIKIPIEIMTSSDLSLRLFLYSILLLVVGSRSFFSSSWSSPSHFISRPSAEGKEKRRQESREEKARGKRKETDVTVI